MCTYIRITTSKSLTRESDPRDLVLYLGGGRMFYFRAVSEGRVILTFRYRMTTGEDYSTSIETSPPLTLGQPWQSFATLLWHANVCVRVCVLSGVYTSYYIIAISVRRTTKWTTNRFGWVIKNVHLTSKLITCFILSLTIPFSWFQSSIHSFNSQSSYIPWILCMSFLFDYCLRKQYFIYITAPSAVKITTI